MALPTYSSDAGYLGYRDLPSDKRAVPGAIYAAPRAAGGWDVIHLSDDDGEEAVLAHFDTEAEAETYVSVLADA